MGPVPDWEGRGACCGFPAIGIVLSVEESPRTLGTVSPAEDAQ
ncbi:hypothetical protein HMPREF9058_1332 [Actinomyces sp. oral taxon 175 str. F0384]|nr:hypothetical protein HMPREF9058_1332 [Actinomyces sp. oral taxon 175 str. F0384]